MHAATTIIGHLTDEPVLNRIGEDTYVCRLRVASSRRVRRAGTNGTQEQARQEAANNLQAAGYQPTGAPTPPGNGATNRPQEDNWVDQDVLFIDVECWGQLAVNAKKSLQKGRPVIAVGYLYTNNWQDKEGNPRQATRLRATNVALELSRYVAGSRKSTPEDVRGIPGVDIPAPGGAHEDMIANHYPARGTQHTGDDDGAAPEEYDAALADDAGAEARQVEARPATVGV